MIPPLVAEEVENGIKNWMEAAFPIHTPLFENLFQDWFKRRDNQFKGPWVSLDLPFESTDFWPDQVEIFNSAHPPYVHQARAYKRLWRLNPQSTIVATGTGSGKSEAFMHPILSTCLLANQSGLKGIKAILIYPMNALARDQSQRFARMIHASGALKGKIRVGLYVGGNPENSTTVMSPNQVITQKEALQEEPPDILLTNYKMLDYLLIRKEDQKLWHLNLMHPTALRYLVVDELHTFDGAQGTDLACLIRRLKAHLKVPIGQVAGVGTSATIGGENSLQEQLEFATTVFGETFDSDSIIREERKQIHAIFEIQNLRANTPKVQELLELKNHRFSTQIDLIFNLERVLFSDLEETQDNLTDQEHAGRIWEKLKCDMGFYNLMQILERNRNPQTIEELIETLAPTLSPEFLQNPEAARTWLIGMLSLLSFVKRFSPAAPGVKMQFWIRELGRTVCHFEAPNTDDEASPYSPHLYLSDDLSEEKLQKSLPLAHCRDCGTVALVGVQKNETLQTDLKAFYQAYMKPYPNENIWMGIPVTKDSRLHDQNRLHIKHFCPGCLHLQPIHEEGKKNCSGCGNVAAKQLIRVYVPDLVKTRSNQKGMVRKFASRVCPCCNSGEDMNVLGLRANLLASTTIEHLFGSLAGDQKDSRLLAFSDNVQDAALRAGYFTARTYRSGLRHALQGFVESSARQLSFQDLLDEFPKAKGSSLSPEEFCFRFLHPDLRWLNDYRELEDAKPLPEGSNLPAIVTRRMQFSLLEEMGTGSTRGRSLRRTRRVWLKPDEERITEALNYIQTNFEEYRLNPTPSEELRPLLYWLCHLMMETGAWDFEGHRGLASGDSRQKFNAIQQKQGGFRLPALSFKSRLKWPALMFPRARISQDTQLTPIRSDRSKDCNIYEELFLGFLENRGEAERFNWLKSVFSGLQTAQVLECRTVENLAHVFRLKPQAMQLSSELVLFSCPCGFSKVIDRTLAKSFISCPAPKCQETPSLKESHHFQDLHHFIPIQGHEHTGNLERSRREQVEDSFKRKLPDRKLSDFNLLSCTPTLEMGIDIGDLSSVLLCSIPPQEASYLQRIGRSGRAYGSSLNLAIANLAPHDLYFYADPSRMIAGEVTPPGLFLQAVSILRRQLAAWCLGRFLEVPRHVLPANLNLAMNTISSRRVDAFPLNFLQWSADHAKELFAEFAAAFHGSLQPQTLQSLKNWLEGAKDSIAGDPFVIFFSAPFDVALQQRQKLVARIRELKPKIKKLESEKESNRIDEEAQKTLQSFQDETRSLKTLLNQLKNKPLLEWMTVEGLLPNYAFPEEGVTLKSVILKSESKDQEKPSFSWELKRPAHTALSELAPNSVFYGHRSKVKIEEIDLKASTVHDYFCCKNCSYMSKTHFDACAACHYSDEPPTSSQLIELKQVIAITRDREALIREDDDERHLQFFDRDMFVDPLDMERGETTYQLENEELPFGFEYRKRVRLRDINFGPESEFLHSGSEFRVDGKNRSGEGFEVCASCGRVNTYQRDGDYHRKGCKKDKILKSAWLFREFTTEALAILLPVDVTDHSPERDSLVASLQLALRLQFGGQVQHVRSMVYREPVSSGVDGTLNQRDFILLYDTVPGGTGYLRKLLGEEQDSGRPAFMGALKLALEHLKSCGCNLNKELDGCHRCLLAFRSDARRDKISRDVARLLLEKILDERHELKKVSDLNTIRPGSASESVLEERFIKQICDGATRAGFTVDATLRSGKLAYQFRQKETPRFLLRQQVDLKELGSAVPGRADFYLEPIRDPMQPGIVIFTDGWQYHRERFKEDIQQRSSLIAAGNLVISLAFKDVDNPKSATDVPGYLKLSEQSLKEIKGAENTRLLALWQDSEINLLIRLMTLTSYSKNQSVLDLKALSFTRFEEQRRARKVTRKVSFCDWDEIHAERTAYVHEKLSEKVCIYEAADFNDPTEKKFFTALQFHEYHFEETEFSEWHQILKLMNRLQFQNLKQSDDLIRDFLIVQDEVRGASRATSQGVDVKEIEELVSLCLEPDLMRPLLQELKDKSLPLPQIGIDLVAEDSREVVGMAELYWPEFGLAVVEEFPAKGIGDSISILMLADLTTPQGRENIINTLKGKLNAVES